MAETGDLSAVTAGAVMHCFGLQDVTTGTSADVEPIHRLGVGRYRSGQDGRCEKRIAELHSFSPHN